MAFALNLTAALTTLLIPPVVVGVADGLAARRRSFLAPVAQLQLASAESYGGPPKSCPPPLFLNIDSHFELDDLPADLIGH